MSNNGTWYSEAPLKEPFHVRERFKYKISLQYIAKRLLLTERSLVNEDTRIKGKKDE